MYAVVAPGFSCIYSNWNDVERIKALYPYPKFAQVRTEAEAYEFIKRNYTAHFVKTLYNYGNTFKNFYLNIKYMVRSDCVYYRIDTKRVGTLRLKHKNFLIEYRGTEIYAKLLDFSGDNRSLTSHIAAIYNALLLVGGYLDVNFEIPYFSVFYSLTMYSKGQNKAVNATQNMIQRRVGKVAYTLRLVED